MEKYVIYQIFFVFRLGRLIPSNLTILFIFISSLNYCTKMHTHEMHTHVCLIWSHFKCIHIQEDKNRQEC